MKKYKARENASLSIQFYRDNSGEMNMLLTANKDDFSGEILNAAKWGLDLYKWDKLEESDRKFLAQLCYSFRSKYEEEYFSSIN